MLFDYIFFDYRFNQFAYQAEFLRSLFFNDNTEISKSESYHKFQNAQNGIHENKLLFSQQTKSTVGWIKSFIPGTRPFSIRRKLGEQFRVANDSFIRCSFACIKENMKVQRKSVNEKIDLVKKNENQKKLIISHVPNKPSLDCGLQAISGRLGMWRM